MKATARDLLSPSRTGELGLGRGLGEFAYGVWSGARGQPCGSLTLLPGQTTFSVHFPAIPRARGDLG